MSRTNSIHVAAAVILALPAMLFLRPHDARAAEFSEDSVVAGRRLAEAWCKECHAIETSPTRTPNAAASDFVDIAGHPSTTALSLKVFLRTNHPSMPNIVIAPHQADELVDYILSLKRN
jgi:mono/diheme cytochrome c family protein